MPLGKLIYGQPIRDHRDWNDGSPVLSGERSQHERPPAAVVPSVVPANVT